MESLIEISGLTKKFRKTTALDNVTFSIPKGEICGLIGNNGAGKTTLLKLLCGLLKPSKGKIKYSAGTDNRKIGMLIERPGLYGDLPAFENLKAKTYSIGYKCDNKELTDLLRLVGLENTGKKLASRFSMGMKQRLGIAIALVGNPDLLILDEPINGLDPEGIVDIRNLILKLHRERGITMIISSHLLDELAKIATRLCFLKEGKLLAEGAVGDLLRESECETIEDWYLKVNASQT